MAMAKSEGGYHPVYFSHTWDRKDDRLWGLWCLIGSKLVYEDVNEHSKVVNINRINEIWYKDPIAFSLLKTIIRQNAKAEVVKVFQLKERAEIKRMLAFAPNPELVVHSKSEFLAIVSDGDEKEVMVWIWDLNRSW